MADRQLRKIFKFFHSPRNYLGTVSIVFVLALLILNRMFPANSAEPAIEKPFGSSSDIALQAQAAYVLDGISGKEIYSLNGEMQLPLASLTKIMMAVTALSVVPKNAVVTITADSLASDGDSGLYGNERWNLKDLLNLTLIESSNDGASAIAFAAGQAATVAEAVPFGDKKQNGSPEQLFVSIMNKKAEEIGLTQTYFLNPTGLDENGYVSGGYGSARDVSKLFLYAVTKYPDVFEGTRYSGRQFDSLSSLRHFARNTNSVVNRFPSLLASKTGYTDLAGGNLTIAFDAGPGHPVVISVLGSTESGRFKDAEKLLWATLDYINNQ